MMQNNYHGVYIVHFIDADFCSDNDYFAKVEKACEFAASLSNDHPSAPLGIFIQDGGEGRDCKLPIYIYISGTAYSPNAPPSE